MQLIEDERQCRVFELRSMRIRLNKQTNNFEFCKKYTQYIHSHIKSYTSLNIYTGHTIGPKEVRTLRVLQLRVLQLRYSMVALDNRSFIHY